MQDSASTERNDMKEARGQVRSWLEELGWLVEDQPTDKGLAWRLKASHRSGGQRVVALQPSDRPDIVLLGGSVAPSGPHPQKLAALEPGVLREFLWDLRFELVRQHYQFRIEGPRVKRVAFNRTLYWDEGVKRSEFFRAVEEIHHGVLTVQWMIQRLLDEPPPPEMVKVVGFDPVN